MQETYKFALITLFLIYLSNAEANNFSLRCLEYTKNVQSCGHMVKDLVVGREFADSREFPHAALIGHENDISDFDYNCVGSLITDKFVLSVASCAYGPYRTKAKYVKVGDVHRDQPNINTFTYTIIEMIIHPLHSERIIDHDIALFKLNKNVEFNLFVQPICLPAKNLEPKLAIATGWGRLGPGESKSIILKKVTMEIFTQPDCQAKFEKSKATANGIDYETKLCGGSHTEKGIDTCDADSGAPLQIYNPDGAECMYTLVGLTSFGIRNCGTPGVPGVYTRVHRYINWIEEILNME